MGLDWYFIWKAILGDSRRAKIVAKTALLTWLCTHMHEPLHLKFLLSSLLLQEGFCVGGRK